MAIDWDKELAEAQYRNDGRVAKAIVLAFAEVLLDDLKAGYCWDGSDALVEWAQEAYGVDLVKLLAGRDDLSWHTARNRVEKLLHGGKEAE